MFKNLNAHDIRYRVDVSNDASPSESDVVYPAMKRALRIRETVTDEIVIDGVLIKTTRLGEIEGLPAPEKGVIFIVSMPTAERAYAMGRRDCVSPDTENGAVKFKLPNGQNGTYAVRAFRFIDGGKS